MRDDVLICGTSWEQHATEGRCEYCGKKALVKQEPFGQQPACKKCWEDICYGSDDDD